MCMYIYKSKNLCVSQTSDPQRIWWGGLGVLALVRVCRARLALQNPSTRDVVAINALDDGAKRSSSGYTLLCCVVCGAVLW